MYYSRIEQYGENQIRKNYLFT